MGGFKWEERVITGVVLGGQEGLRPEHPGSPKAVDGAMGTSLHAGSRRAKMVGMQGTLYAAGPWVMTPPSVQGATSSTETAAQEGWGREQTSEKSQENSEQRQANEDQEPFVGGQQNGGPMGGAKRRGEDH